MRSLFVSRWRKETFPRQWGVDNFRCSKSYSFPTKHQKSFRMEKLLQKEDFLICVVYTIESLRLFYAVVFSSIRVGWSLQHNVSTQTLMALQKISLSFSVDPSTLTMTITKTSKSDLLHVQKSLSRFLIRMKRLFMNLGMELSQRIRHNYVEIGQGSKLDVTKAVSFDKTLSHLEQTLSHWDGDRTNDLFWGRIAYCT